MKTIKAKVHMLPTEDISQVHYNKVRYPNEIKYELSFHKEPSKCKNDGLCSGNQHLYITTDEEVILGDGKVFLYEGKTYVSSTSNRFDDFDMVKAKNIIASTDESLPFNLSQIPQSFIEEYCKAGGIDEVDVEYEEFSLNGGGRPNATVLEPKLNPDNTIIIHPVEEMYTADSINTLRKLANAIIGPASEILPDTYDKELKAYWDWIEENL